MIIGINGKIGSGKDTIGRIIQYLTLPGKRGEYIGFETYDDATLERNSPFKIKKFAGKLKTIASLLTGVPVEMFEDQEFKKQYMSEEWNSFLSIDFPEMTGKEVKDSDSVLVETTYKRMTYREFLQKLGTEAMRDGLHTNVWVNALFADYKYEIHRTEVPTRAAGFIDQHVYPNWIITDMRFPNEMDAVKEKGGITIRVVRPKVESVVDKMRPYSDLINHGTPMPKEHPSETSLDSAEFDYKIVNNGSIEDLVEKVREILIKENII